jgi:aarF domain-containing kinase
MKPYNPNKAVHVENNLSMKEIYNLQRQAKDRIRKVLKDTSKLPRELIFVGRNMNLVRSINKELGSLVNRVNIMSRYAIQGIEKTNALRRWKFEFNLWLMSIAFYLNQSWRWLNMILFKRQIDGFEDILDNKMKDQMMKFGIRTINVKTFDA